MRKKVTMTASLLLLATQFCHARALTLAEADAIIVILLFVVIVLLVLGGISLHYNRVVSRRNELLHRILKALDDYRAIVGDGTLPMDQQEEMLMKKNQPKQKTDNAAQTDEGLTFFVKMDARVNKESFLNAFKFAFGITPTDYLNSMSMMFKKKGVSAKQ